MICFRKNGLDFSACGFPLVRLAAPGVPIRPGAAGGGGDCVGQGGGDHGDRGSRGGGGVSLWWL